jgi:hypothetical protein
MSLVNDDRYARLWFSSTLKDKALECLEWFWSNPTASFPTWTSLRDIFLRKFETVVDQRDALIVLSQLKQIEDETITEFVRRFKLVKDRCEERRNASRN